MLLSLSTPKKEAVRERSRSPLRGTDEKSHASLSSEGEVSSLAGGDGACRAVCEAPPYVHQQALEESGSEDDDEEEGEEKEEKRSAPATPLVAETKSEFLDTAGPCTLR